jgi:hypothetical protein
MFPTVFYFKEYEPLMEQRKKPKNRNCKTISKERITPVLFQNPLEEKLHKHLLFYAATSLLKKPETLINQPCIKKNLHKR